MNLYIIDSDSLNMNPQVDSFDSRGKRSIQGSKCSNSSPRTEEDLCLTERPFGNLTLHIGPGYAVGDHCLTPKSQPGFLQPGESDVSG